MLTLLQVSATHLATFWWHHFWELPFRDLLANKQDTESKGYALEDDFELAYELDPRQITKKSDYGIHSGEVRHALLKSAV
jgi:hypothetical protein